MMAPSLRQWAMLAYVFALIVLGGASAAGTGGNSALQFGGAALIAWTAWADGFTGEHTGLRRFLIAFGLLAALQFVPLPPALWSHFPGRDTIAEGYRLAGMELPWLPFSLDPWASLQSLVWWIPPLALLVAFRSPSAPSTRHLVWLVAGVAYASVILAGVQYFGGSGYFYAITNKGNGVGLFANSNHFGTFLLLAMALVGGQWLHDRPTGRHGKSRFTPLYAIGARLLPLALGIAMTNSLAATLLMVPLLAGLYVAARPDMRINWLLAAFSAVVIGAGLVWLLASGLAANDLMAKSGTAGISRGEFLRNGAKALADFAPLGSGIGTFRDLYPWYEDAAQVGTTYANHAHNDLLELLIETGALGAIVLALFVWWLVTTAWRIWNHDRAENPVAVMATLGIGLALIHSLVDYPLRTAAVSGLVALCCVFASRKAEPRGAMNQSVGAGKRETLMEI